MRILIILNADAGPQAGVVPEYNGLIEAYYLFRDAGIDVVLAAAGGGSASESTGTVSGRDDTAAARGLRRFSSDRQARDVMNDLVDLAYVCAEDFDAALCLGPQRFDTSSGAARETITCGPFAARSTRSRMTRTRSPTLNCSSRLCSRRGIRASALKTPFGGEEEEAEMPAELPEVGGDA